MAYVNAADLPLASKYVTPNVGEAWDANVFAAKMNQFRSEWFSLLSPDGNTLDLYSWIIPLTNDINRMTATNPTLEDLWRIMFDISGAVSIAANAEASGDISTALAASLLAAYNNVFS